MDRQMINYLPPILREIREYKVVLTDAEQAEFSEIWNAVDEVFSNQFVLDATKTGILRWEGILGIQPKGTDTLDARKFRILTRLNESLPYTLTTLKEMLQALCGIDGYSVELQNDVYALIVKVALIAKSNYKDVEELLRRVVPANMVIDLSLKYNQHSTLAKFTHKELHGYTQTELRNEVLNHARL